jgi:hypothetical protein
MNNLSKENLKKLAEIANKQYTDLVKWLYDNHKDVLRKWEATQGKLRIEFLGEEI